MSKWTEYLAWRKKASAGLAAHDVGVLIEDLLMAGVPEKQKHRSNGKKKNTVERK